LEARKKGRKTDREGWREKGRKKKHLRILKMYLHKNSQKTRKRRKFPQPDKRDLQEPYKPHHS
jgi:hypothetical protein